MRPPPKPTQPPRGMEMKTAIDHIYSQMNELAEWMYEAAQAAEEASAGEQAATQNGRRR